MRIAAISDLHGHIGFDLPACDLLLIAGDICPDKVGSFWTRTDPDLCASWIEKRLLPWLNPLVYDGKIKRVVMTWGNHDWTQRMGQIDLPKKFTIEIDEEVEVDGIRIWCSPWSNEFCGWAWMKDPRDLIEIYEKIPAGIDIIMSHQPPKGFGDLAPRFNSPGEHVGSQELLHTIDRVNPKVVVCGHIHDGHGIYNYQDTTIYNVSVVDERYQRVHGATEFVWAQP